MKKIIKYVFLEILRHKVIAIYFFTLLSAVLGVFLLDTDTSKATLSVINIILLIVPLFSLVFSTIHFYHSYDFIELLLTQPVNRSQIFFSEFYGTLISLSLAFILGAGLPILFFQANELGLTVLISGVLLGAVFIALAFVCAIWTKDKARGMGFALLIWLFFTLIYDGLVLLLMFAYSDYPLEGTLFVIVSLNPVDISRILMLMQTDSSMMLGFTGAIFHNFLGSIWGTLLAIALLVSWVLLPIFFANRRFVRYDV